VPVEEYLNTSYEPDVDFVDGVLVRRNVGTQLHGRLQLIVGMYLESFRESHRIKVFVETRLLVEPRAYRVPDVMAVPAPVQKGKVVVDVPAIIVEIKSPKDTFDDIVERCGEYQRLGVPNILLMDPDHDLTFLFDDGSFRRLTGTSVALSVGERPALDFRFAELLTRLHAD